MLFFSFVLFLVSLCAYTIFRWLMLFDFTVPEIDLVSYVRSRRGKKKKTLRQAQGKLHFMAIYPHPDDETMMSGGTIARYARYRDVRWTIVSVTRGEHGDELMKSVSPQKLAKIRMHELHRACEVLGVSQIIYGPFEDGTLKKEKKRLARFLTEFYKDEKPDLVFTFERDGIYGHPDHVTLSAVIADLQKKFPSVAVLYGTLPKKLLDKLDLPTHMADDPDGLLQAEPEWRIMFPHEGWKKYLAARCHQSQNLNGSGKNPLWVSTILYPVEYYSTQ